MRLFAATCLLLTSTAAFAAPDPARRAAERALFEKIVEIPTVEGRTAETKFASAAAVQGLLEHWQQALVEIDFLDPAAPKKLMPRLNQLLNRAQLADEEIHILRGIAKAMVKDRSKPE